MKALVVREGKAFFGGEKVYLSKYNLIFNLGTGRNILLNSLSGAVDIVDDKTASIIKKAGGDLKLENDFSKELIERGYAYRNKEEEGAKLRQMHLNWLKTMKEKPAHFFLNVTYACNLNCTYCFQDSALRKSPVMDSKTIEKAFQAMNEIHSKSSARKKPVVSLFGGEPLLNTPIQKASIKKILGFCENNGLDIRIITNGVDLAEYSELLSKYKLEYVQVTLDGPAKMHDKRRKFADGRGSFKQIEKGIDKALSMGVPVCIRINTDKENIECLPELAEFIHKKRWAEAGLTAYIGPVRDISCADYSNFIPMHKLLKRIFELYKEKPITKNIALVGWIWLDNIKMLAKKGMMRPPQFSFCGANAKRYCLDCFGDVYPCVSITGKREYKIGRFIPDLEIDERTEKNWRRRSIKTIPECSKCSLGPLCGGGCSFLSLTKKGYLMKRSCFGLKKLLEMGVDYYFKERG